MAKTMAKLVRGEVYYLRDKRFEKGQEVEVTADEVDHLKENAVDSVTVTGSTPEENVAEFRQKFEFREVAESDGDKPAPKRERPGKPAAE